MCQNPNHWLKVHVLKEEGDEPFYKTEVQFGDGNPHVVGPAIAAALLKAKIYEHSVVVVDVLPYCRNCQNPSGVGVSGKLVWEKVPSGKLNEAITNFILGLLTILREGNTILYEAKVLSDEIELAERESFGNPPKNPDLN